MQILFYTGWVFLVLAFFAAGAEPFLAQFGRGGLMVSAYDLWYALAPGALVITEIRMEQFSPVLWDTVIFNMLRAPGWFLLGLPGVLLTWYYRPNRIMSPEIREEYERQRESLFVIDELSREAQLDESYDPKEDDRAPVHLLFDLEEEEDPDIRDSLESRHHPAGYPPEDYADDYLHDLAQDQMAAREGQSSHVDADIAEHIRIIDGLAFTQPGQPPPGKGLGKDTGLRKGKAVEKQGEDKNEDGSDEPDPPPGKPERQQ